MADDTEAKRVRKVLVTNNDVGPRFINTARGQETILVGQTLGTEMTGAQIDALDDEYVHNTEDAPRFTVDLLDGDIPAAGDQGKALKSLSVSKLREIAAAEGVQLTGRTNPDNAGEALPDLTKAADIASAIEAHRIANPA